ncbi:MAG: Rrf2 family transcriptional regulator [Bacteroidales bacterium]|nr:Rrf2 family transcriptional regulator [Bacteroidales bacterium]
MISKSCKDAIRAAIYLASKSDEDVNLSAKEIAKDIEAPEAFIGKILQVLRKHRIISSLKGPYGGFYCEEHQLSIPIINIVNAVDGLAVFNECVLGLKECSAEHPCPMHHQYIETRDMMLKSFEETTIGNLASNLKLGSVFITNI